jgi:hypothetical protein
MYVKTLGLLLCCLFGMILPMAAQQSFPSSPLDTIIARDAFLGKSYYMHGKQMDLSVMRWFMSDYVEPYDQIRLAVMTDQLSIAGYGLGGLFAFSGLFIYEDNRPLARELLKIGGISIGGGLILQIFSEAYQKKAVRLYNREILHQFESAKALTMEVEWDGGTVRAILRW